MWNSRTLSRPRPHARARTTITALAQEYFARHEVWCRSFRLTRSTMLGTLTTNTPLSRRENRVVYCCSGSGGMGASGSCCHNCIAGSNAGVAASDSANAEPLLRRRSCACLGGSKGKSGFSSGLQQQRRRLAVPSTLYVAPPRQSGLYLVSIPSAATVDLVARDCLRGRRRNTGAGESFADTV